MATHELSNFVYSGPLTGNSYLFGVASGLADTNPDTIKLTLLYDYIKSLTDTLYPTQGQLSSLSDVVDAKMGRIGSVWQGQNFTTTAFAYATDPTGLVTKAQAEAIAAAAGGSYAGLVPHPNLDVTADILQIWDVDAMAYYSVTPEALLLGAGYVNKTGTPADNQIAVFTDADTIEGDAGLTWNASTLQIISGIGSTHFSTFAGSGNLAFEIGSYDTGTGGSNYATYFGVQAANVDGYSDGMYSQLQRGTFASPAAVADLDYVGMITAWAHDGTGARRVGGMATIIDGTPALNNIPARLLFEVNTGASTTTIGVALNSDLSFSPYVDNAAALGNATYKWSDLFLASGSVINWDAGDVTCTHAANSLSWSGATTQYVFNDGPIKNARSATQAALLLDRTDTHLDNALVGLVLASGRDDAGAYAEYARTQYYCGSDTAGAEYGYIMWSLTANAVLQHSLLLNYASLRPYADDLLSLGLAGTAWSDLYLAAGGVVNWNNGAAKISEAAGSITIDGDGIYFRSAAGVNRFIAGNTYFAPTSNDGGPLGTATEGWSDLYLASGGVINWNASDVTITHATNSLIVAGADAGVIFTQGASGATARGDGDIAVFEGAGNIGVSLINVPTGASSIFFTDTSGDAYLQFNHNANEFYFSNSVMPVTNDAAALGTASLQWSDLFLASGAVINWNAGDVVITHASNTLSLTGGYLAAYYNGTAATAALNSVNQFDANNLCALVLRGDRATYASGDIVYQSFQLDNSVGTPQEVARISGYQWDNTSTAEYAELVFNVRHAGTITANAHFGGVTWRGSSNDQIALGTASVAFSDLFLAAGGVINWDNGDVRLIHSANNLLLSGGFLNIISDVAASTPALYVQNQSTGAGLAVAEFRAHTAGTAANNDYGYIQFRLKDSIGNSQDAARFYWQATDVTDGAESVQCFWGVTTGGTYAHRLVMDGAYLRPYTHDAMYLGSSANSWSDLYLASGGVINWGASNVTLTHTTGQLSLAGNLDVSGTLAGASLSLDGAAGMSWTSGVNTFSLNDGASNVTPTMGVRNTSGKFAALLAGTTGSAFVFDATGSFLIQSDSAANYTSESLGSGTNRFSVSTTAIRSYLNHDFDAGIDVTGNITVTGTVDGRDIAADGSTLDALSNTAVTLQGTWDASSGSFPGGGTAQAGYSYIVSVSGTVDSVSFVANDRIVAITDNASTTTYAANWHKLDYTDQVLSVASKTGAVTLVEADLTDLGTTIVLDSDIGSTVQAYSADNLFKTGTPANNQIAVFTNATTVEGTAELTFDSTTLSVNNGGVTVAPHTNAVDLVLANSTGNAGITIHGTSYGSIHFADGTTGTEPYAGLIRYYHPGNYFEWYVNGTAELRLDNTQFYPSSDDGLALGIGTNGWSDLYLANGGTINFNNNDVIIAHATNSLSLSGGQFLFYNDNSVGVPPISATNQADGTSVYVLSLRGDNTTAAANDEIYATWLMDDSAGTATEFARLTTVATNITDTTEIGRFEIATAYNGTPTDVATFSRDTIQFIQGGGTRAFTINGQGCHFNTTFTVGSAETWSSAGSLEVVSPITTRDNLWLKAAASQTADYIKLVNSSEVEVASWDVTGSFQLPAAATINWDAGDVTLTHGANVLKVEGGNLNILSGNVSAGWESGVEGGVWLTKTSQYGTAGVQGLDSSFSAATLALQPAGGSITVGGTVSPATTDTAALGTSSLQWSDLFLASGGVINWANGDWIIQHSSNQLNFNINATDLGFQIGSYDTGSGGTNYATYAGLTAVNADAYSDGFYSQLARGTWSSKAAVADGDYVGGITMWAHDGTAMRRIAGIGSIVDGTPALNDVASRLLFEVNTGASGTTITLALNADKSFSPYTNDFAALGNTSLGWSDLHLATGGVINWANGDFTATHSSGALALSGNVDVGGTFSLSGDISPAQITADQNDYNPTGLSTATRLRLSTDATRTVTGLSGGADGRVIMIHNIGANALVLADEDVLSTAGNRFALPSGDQALSQDETLLVCYDATTSRWRPVGGSGAAGGASVTYSATPPGLPSTGDLWYDTDTATLFLWTGSEWIEAAPNPAVGASTTRLLDDISSGFNGSTTAFSLTYGGGAVTPDSENQLLITVNAVVQSPSDYSVSGSTLTFSSAPGASDTCDILCLPAGGGDATVADGLEQFAATARSETLLAAALCEANIAVNSGCVVAQEYGNATTGTAAASGTEYRVDQFPCSWSVSTSTLKTSSGSTPSLAGYSSYVGFIGTAAVTYGASNFAGIAHQIEGKDVAHLRWGTAYAKDIKVGFWLYATNAGTYCVSVRNASAARSYVRTVTATSGWGFYTVTITGDTSGTWPADTTAWGSVWVGGASGSTYQTTADAWQSGSYVSTSGATNPFQAANDEFYLTGLVIVPADMSFPASGYMYLTQRPFEEELQKCERFWQASKNGQTAAWGVNGPYSYVPGVATASGTSIQFPGIFRTRMRTQPTVTLYAGSTSGSIDVSAVSRTATAADIYHTGFGAITNTSGVTWADGSYLKANWVANARM